MNIFQRNDNWQDERTGKITASRIKDISAKPKTGKMLNAEMFKILIERLTGEADERFVSKAMQWGIDNEANAITAYENATGSFVTGNGFIPHPTIPMSGASPDGLVGSDGQIEVKCPERENHMNTLLSGEIPCEHIPQITWQLACTGREWCDFISYDPRFNDELFLFIKRVYAKDLDITGLEKTVIECNAKLDAIIEKLKGGQNG